MRWDSLANQEKVMAASALFAVLSSSSNRQEATQGQAARSDCAATSRGQICLILATLGRYGSCAIGRTRNSGRDVRGSALEVAVAV